MPNVESEARYQYIVEATRREIACALARSKEPKKKAQKLKLSKERIEAFALSLQPFMAAPHQYDEYPDGVQGKTSLESVPGPTRLLTLYPKERISLMQIMSESPPFSDVLLERDASGRLAVTVFWMGK